MCQITCVLFIRSLSLCIPSFIRVYTCTHTLPMYIHAHSDLTFSTRPAPPTIVVPMPSKHQPATWQLCQLCTSVLLWTRGPSASCNDRPTRAKADATRPATPGGQQIVAPEASSLLFNQDGIGYLVAGKRSYAWVTKVFKCNIKVDSSGHQWACCENATDVPLEEYMLGWRRL